MRLRLCAPLILTAVTGLLGSCVDADSPTGVGPDGVSLSMSASLLPSAANATALPVNRIRAVAVRTADDVAIVEDTFDVSPDDAEWEIELNVPTGETVVVLLYLVHVAEDGSESVEFSGVTDPVTPVAGFEASPANVELVRGPPANLYVTSVTIDEMPPTMILGAAASLSASVTTDATDPPTVFWTALDPDFVTVEGSTATAVAVGTGRVVASAGSFADTASIEVLRPPVDSVRVSPDSASFGVGTALTYTAALFDADGNPLEGREVRWSVGDEAVATVDSLTGQVIGVAPGLSTVTATSEGVSDAAVLVVLAVTGSAEVTVVTTGSLLDTEYSVTVGPLQQSVAANGSVTFSGLAPGNQTVQLGGVAENCAVTGSSTLNVSVVAGEVAVAAFAVTCESPDDVLAQGIQALEDALFTALGIGSVAGLDDFTFEDANALFSQALDLSPSNDTAAFGVAVTTIFMLEDDPDVRALADSWDAWLQEEPAGAPMVRPLMGPAMATTWETGTLPLELSAVMLQDVAHAGVAVAQLAQEPLLVTGAPPSVVQHQVVLDQVVRPALEAALAALDDIASPAFVFWVTERMQGETADTADPLELDYTEVLALRAGLHVALASIDVATAYDLTADGADLQSPEDLVAALQPGSSFLTLDPADGRAKLADALPRLRSAADILVQGLDNLQAEEVDQTDDIIKYDPNGFDGLTPADIDEARNVIMDVDEALSGPYPIVLNEGLEDEFTVTVDASRFFTNPIEDFKALLPAYEVFITPAGETETMVVFRWTALNLDEWTFPDPTFSEILPGMTTQALIDDLGADELYFEASLVAGHYRLISIDGVECLDAFYNEGELCYVNDLAWDDGSLDLDGFDGLAESYLSMTSTPNATFTSAYGPYTVAIGDGYHLLTMSLTDDDGPLNLNGDYSATFEDIDGYGMIDTYGRYRGGSRITLSYSGSTWVFEKQYY